MKEPMEITRENLLHLIHSGTKRKSLSILRLENEAGVPRDTVRDFLRGKTQILRADKLQKIMRVLDPPRKVPVIGTVGAGGAITPSTTPEELDTPPGVDSKDIVAVRIKGNAMQPLFYEGWIIYFSEHHDINIPPLRGGWQVPYGKPKKPATKKPEDSLEDFLGKPCIVKIKDGQMMLRTLKRGTKSGQYNLISYSTPDIKNAKLDWAAKIIFIRTE